MDGATDAVLHAERRTDGVLVLTIDDGGPGVLRPEVVDALRTALSEHADAPVLLRGREGMFCAGLDLKWMLERGPDGVGALLTACGLALVALLTHPRPVVTAATGHAIAAGTMLAIAADHVVAADGFRWGLNETANGMEIPRFGIELAAGRLAPHDLDHLLLAGGLIQTGAARTIGLVDQVLPAADVLGAAEEELMRRCALPAAAYAGNKHRLRSARAEQILVGLRADVDTLVAGMQRADIDGSASAE